MNTCERVLVTGATGGIGRAICFTLAEAAGQAGRPLALAAVASQPGPALDALVRELEVAGVRAIGVAANLAERNAGVQAVEQAVAFCGGLDALVSNAGIARPGALAELSVYDWDLLFAVNARATWLLAQAAHDALAASRGAIVAVASMAGMFPQPKGGAYSASKAALIMLCRQLAQEWAPEGIRVNSVSPGMIRTPLTEAIYRNDDVRARRESMVPLRRIGQPEDVAGTVAYLLSPQAAYITGENLKMDGGLCDHVMETIPGLPRP